MGGVDAFPLVPVRPSAPNSLRSTRPAPTTRGACSDCRYQTNRRGPRGQSHGERRTSRVEPNCGCRGFECGRRSSWLIPEHWGFEGDLELRGRGRVLTCCTPSEAARMSSRCLLHVEIRNKRSIGGNRKETPKRLPTEVAAKTLRARRRLEFPLRFPPRPSPSAVGASSPPRPKSSPQRHPVCRRDVRQFSTKSKRSHRTPRGCD